MFDCENCTAFWIIRYSVLSLSLLFAIVAFVVIIRNRLYHRMVMIYVSIAVGCQGLMALSALFFSYNFVVGENGKILLTS